MTDPVVHCPACRRPVGWIGWACRHCGRGFSDHERTAWKRQRGGRWRAVGLMAGLVFAGLARFGDDVSEI
jgi:predicted amidophosphoribosyltransferase